MSFRARRDVIPRPPQGHSEPADMSFRAQRGISLWLVPLATGEKTHGYVRSPAPRRDSPGGLPEGARSDRDRGGEGLGRHAQDSLVDSQRSLRHHGGNGAAAVPGVWEHAGTLVANAACLRSLASEAPRQEVARQAVLRPGAGLTDGLTVVTGDRSDYDRAHVLVVNPWDMS